jgi:hypothetical protein
MPKKKRKFRRPRYVAKPEPPQVVGLELDRKLCVHCAKATLKRLEDDPQTRGKNYALETRLNILDLWWERTKGMRCLLKPSENAVRSGRAPLNCPYELEILLEKNGKNGHK